MASGWPWSEDEVARMTGKERGAGSVGEAGGLHSSKKDERDSTSLWSRAGRGGESPSPSSRKLPLSLLDERSERRVGVGEVRVWRLSRAVVKSMKESWSAGAEWVREGGCESVLPRYSRAKEVAVQSPRAGDGLGRTARVERSSI